MTEPVVDAAGDRTDLVFEPIGEVQLKGFSEPTALYRRPSARLTSRPCASARRTSTLLLRRPPLCDALERACGWCAGCRRSRRRARTSGACRRAAGSACAACGSLPARAVLVAHGLHGLPFTIQPVDADAARSRASAATRSAAPRLRVSSRLRGPDQREGGGRVSCRVAGRVGRRRSRRASAPRFSRPPVTVLPASVGRRSTGLQERGAHLVDARLRVAWTGRGRPRRLTNGAAIDVPLKDA